MKKFILKIYKKILYGYKSDSKSFIKYLRNKGVNIGNNVSIYEPYTNYIDVQKPWMINIGDNVEITKGVIILTHEYDWSVIKQKYGEILGCRGKVSIGNNVFIGMNTIILKGTTIGNNVIIGAQSLVCKDIPDNVVVAGNPAKIICSLDEYYQKRTRQYGKEAEELFLEYYRKYNKVPSKEIFDEFFWLFEDDIEEMPIEFKRKMKLTGNENYTNSKFISRIPQYKNFDEFTKHCLEIYKKHI